ncbi:MAG: hypothetical protein K8S14_06360 [Actinomycetia bacterium]|nr:hypothetical protein [Actinomycetes bacterium]
MWGRDEDNQPLHEDYKIARKILDYLGIYEFERKRSPPEIKSAPDEFYEMVIIET